MDNLKMATVFRDMASRLELEDENPYRIRAYRKAAESIIGLEEPVVQIAKRKQLRHIRGIGKELEQKILELISTGTLRLTSKAPQRTTSSDHDPFRIPGLDTNASRLLHQRFHIESMDDLEKLARSRLLRTLPGIGAGLERTILKGIESLKKR